MFQKIEEHQYTNFNAAIDNMHRLRKKVFYDQLGWDVPAKGDFERDAYDDLGPTYLVWANEWTNEVYASTRLLPTTGPTLLSDVFYQSFPSDLGLEAPGIWETTRTCVNIEALSRDYPEITPSKAFGLICLAKAECALQHGIETLVSNYEPHLARIYRRNGLIFDEVGRADGFGKRPVCCAVFEVSPRVVRSIREAIGFDGDILLTTNEPPADASRPLDQAA